MNDLLPTEEAIFIDAVKACAGLRKRFMEGLSEDERELRRLGVEVSNELVNRLLGAAGLLLAWYDVSAAKTVMVAAEIILDLVDDTDARERMAQRQEEYEHHLIRTAQEAREVTEDERQALKKIARAYLRQQGVVA